MSASEGRASARPAAEVVFEELTERVASVLPADPYVAMLAIGQHLTSDSPDKWLAIATIATKQAIETRFRDPGTPDWSAGR